MNRQEFARIVQAWADGADIQYRYAPLADWSDASHPCWSKEVEYRIKPKTIRWRVALLRGSDDSVFTVLAYPNFGWDKKEPPEFIRWLTDWQELEV
jgi:hypothetical protein